MSCQRTQFSKRMFLLVACCAIWSGTLRADEPILLKQNGSWCWFQGERAVVVDGKVVFTSVSSGDHGGWDSGDLVATSYNLKTSEIRNHKLHAQFQSDDHDVAGICVLPDDRLLAVYGKHGNDHLQRSRITLDPGDITRWTDELSFDVGAGYTYSNVYSLSAEKGRIYNFHRGRGYNPNCTFSDNGGTDWQYGFRLLEWIRDDIKDDSRYTGTDGSRPYVRYASRGIDKIHFFLSDDHPRAYDNSVYHGYYKAGKIYSSDGRELSSPANEGRSTLKPSDFTEVFVGTSDGVAWPSDIRIDDQGHPYVAFSVQVDGAATRQTRGKGGLDHRYYYGRWDGSKWQVHPMAFAGTKLYAGEDDYTGLVALDPQDPNSAVVSTNAHPATGKPLISTGDNQRHWELFEGKTSDGGNTWKWTALTSNSVVDQLRPIIPDWKSDRRILLWARGKLSSYQQYHLDIVARIDER